MKPTFVEAFKVRGYSAEDYERDFPELSAVAHEWAAFLAGQHGLLGFNINGVQGCHQRCTCLHLSAEPAHLYQV